MSENQSSTTPAGNRWLIVVGALLIQLCLGAIYGWGAFTVALQNKPADVAMSLNPELLGVKDKGAYQDKKSQYDALKKAIAEAEKGTDAAAIGKARGDQSAFLALLGCEDAEFAAKKAELQVLTKAVKEASEADAPKAKEALKTFEVVADKQNRAWVERTFDVSKFDKQVFAFSAKDAQWPFSVGLAAFAIMMILAGRWQDKAGPRIVALCGGLVLGAGYALCGLVGGTSLSMMIVLIGLVAGAGIGLGYVCPIAACVKWFPDMKGLITGLAVAGFGAGAYIFVNLAGPWASLIPNYGISTTFLIYGIVFAIFVVAGALLLSNPPAGYKPAGWNPPQPTSGAKKAVQDLTQGETVMRPQFWMIWLTFVLSAGCGLMVIGSLKNFGQKEGGLSPAVAASALGLLALFNGLGRIVWGTLSQKLTARGALILMVFLQAAMMFVLPKMGSTAIALTVAGCWIGFNFGGNFALFPLLTAEFFGTKNLGANYGAVFTSYGVGGILGPMLAGGVWDAMGTYRWAFLIAGGACVLAGLIALVLRAPAASEKAGEAAKAPPKWEMCIGEQILAGLKVAHDCCGLGKQCTPETPMGPGMANSDGPCAVEYRKQKAKTAS